MKQFISLLALMIMLISCEGTEQEKITVHAWMGADEEATEEEVRTQLTDLKEKGIDGLMFSGGHEADNYLKYGKVAKELEMEFHTWIPTMVQNNNPKLEAEWYAVNGLGESAREKPAYVSHYQFACPSRPEVYSFLENLYGTIADIEYVDGIHLDYIRFPDVILARGLWEKYGLVMDREYPQFDYCYCDLCTSTFMEKTGIDINAVEDPSTVEEWKQFRYDLITNIVNKLAAMVHAKGKEINAAVFPGPNSIAKKIVRQEWDKWDLDAFYPMNYNDFYLEGTEWVGTVTKEAVTTIENRKPVFSGLFICPTPETKTAEPDPENHGLVPEELEDAIRQSMINGAAGICLFTPGRMTDEHWAVFEKAIYMDFEDED